MKAAHLVSQLLDESGSLTVSQGPTPNSAIVKVSEPRGVPASALKSLGFAVSYGDERGVTAKTSTGRVLSRMGYDYNSFKPTSLILTFPEGINAQEQAQQLADKYLQKAQGGADRQAQQRATAPQRRKEAAKFYRADYKQSREALYAEFGKQNVNSVTARQIGGDDGYQWNVLINGRSFVNGLTQNEVDHYKRVAYAELVKQNGVR